MSESRGECFWVKKKNVPLKKIVDVLQIIFGWYGKKYEFLGRKYFLTQNFWKNVQAIIFTIFYFVVANILTNILDKTYFFPCMFDVYFKISEKDKSSFPFTYKFSTSFYLMNETFLTCCFNCQELIIKNHKSQVTCFIRFKLI